MATCDLNPLKDILLDEGATLMPYGVEPPPPGSVLRTAVSGERAASPESGDVPMLAAAFGPIELEYASLRKDCVIIDRPDRAVIEVSGADAREFLGRMLTNDVAALKPGESCDSFWLNRKGRIDADLRVLRLGEHEGDKQARFLLDLERGSLDLTLRTLGAYIITEDVTLTARDDVHRISLHGPRAGDLLRAGDQTPAISRLSEGGNAHTRVPGGVRIGVDACSSAGVPGFELYLPRRDAAEVYRCLLAAGRAPTAAPGASFASSNERGVRLEQERRAAAQAGARAEAGPDQFGPLAPASIRLRPCGWFAYNIARIEAGTPLFKIDFGPENLPAETGVIDDRVNFKKGCYLGQEVVARMHARGHPKQRLVALRFDDDLPPGPDALPPLPVQGDRVLAIATGARDAAPVPPEPAATGPSDTPVGRPTPAGADKPLGSITSSTFSPMLGRVPIAFAMLAWSHVAPGTRVLVETDTGAIGATVQDGLRLVP